MNVGDFAEYKDENETLVVKVVEKEGATVRVRERNGLHRIVSVDDLKAIDGVFWMVGEAVQFVSGDRKLVGLVAISPAKNWAKPNDAKKTAPIVVVVPGHFRPAGKHLVANKDVSLWDGPIPENGIPPGEVDDEV